MVEADATQRPIRADAHIHLFRNGFLTDRGISPVGSDEVGTYEVLRREHGIVRALVVAVEHPAYGIGNNDYVAELARTRDWIAPAANLPCWPAPTPQQLDELVAAGHIGVTLFALNAEQADRLAGWPPEVMEWINQRFRVVSLNVAASVIAMIGEFVAALNGCTVLFSHLGLPGRFTTPPDHRTAAERLAGLLALAHHEHVAVKASGYAAISDPPFGYPHPAAFPFAEVVLEAFGPRRLLWGSDFPAAMRWVSFPQLAESWLPTQLSPDERAEVLGGNLLRMLGAAEPTMERTHP